MSFFNGYIRINNKKEPLDKFKDVPLRTLEDVQGCDGFAGVLAPETVLIDIDDQAQAQKLLDIIEAEEVLCQVRQTTRGMHFYFKNDGSFTKCGSHLTLAIGLQADIKVGSTNSIANLKINGKDRKVIYDIFEDEVYGHPPKWLRVIHSNINLLDKAEGEGRNSALFAYILPLQSAGFSKDEIIETLAIVNKYIFQKPLSESEFKTITRDEAFDTSLVPAFYEGKKFLFEQFAKYLVKEHNIKRINGQLHIYKDGVYIADPLKLERLMIDLIPTLNAAHRAEVLKYIELLCCENAPMGSFHYIAFANGIYDLTSGQMMPFDPSIVITNRIPWNYNPTAYSEVVDKTLDKLACNDHQIRALLEEVSAFCLMRINTLRKAFIFTGNKRNGKSTYINMLGAMLGEDNISALDLKDIGDRFRTAELFGKLANLGDDISDKFVEDVSNFKKVVSGDKILVERKGKDPFFFSNYAKFIFSANELPRLRDRTQAVIDRLIIVPFDATFSDDDPDYDPFIAEKLVRRDSMEYLINLSVAGLKRILERKAFTRSSKVESALRGYNEEINPILIFFQDHEKGDFIRESVAYWYQQYIEHCAAYGCVAMSRSAFTKAVLSTYEDMNVYVTRVNGQCVRRFRCSKEGEKV